MKKIYRRVLAMGLSLALAVTSVPTAAFAAGAAIFWGLLPLLIPLVVDHKKGGKKSKIMLDKSDPV